MGFLKDTYSSVSMIWMGDEESSIIIQGPLLLVTLSINLGFFLGGVSTAGLIAFVCVLGGLIILGNFVIWWISGKWVLSTGIMFMAGAISIAIGVGFSSYYHHLIINYSKNMSLNATVEDAPYENWDVFYFSDSPFVDSNYMGEKLVITYSHDDDDGSTTTTYSYYCVAPVRSSKNDSDIVLASVWAYCSVGSRSCHYNLYKHKCMKKWHEPIGSGVRIEPSRKRNAESAVHDAERRYSDLVAVSNAPIIYWNSPSEVFQSWHRTFILALSLSNGIWLLITLILAPGWVMAKMDSRYGYSKINW